MAEKSNESNQPLVESSTAEGEQPAKSSHESKKPDSKKPEPTKPAETKTETKAEKPSRSVLAPIALVVALAGLGGTAYLWHLSQGQQLTQAAAQISQQQQVAELAAASREVQQSLEKSRIQLQQQQQLLASGLERLREQLSSQNKRLLSLSTTDRDDWLLAEAEYLIRLANQRLLMGKEVAGAAQLLKAADEIARELDDSALFPVRKALATDIAALQAAGKLDLEGLYLQLDALAEQAAGLALFKLPEFEAESGSAEQVDGDWQAKLESGLAAAWQKLDGYIQIRRRDEQYQPVLAPEHEAALRQNLRLMVEQAQMALLAGNQRLYDRSLAKAREWLSNYYTLDTEASGAVIKALDQLAGAEVELKLPDISGSLRALKSYVESRHLRGDQVAGDGAES